MTFHYSGVVEASPKTIWETCFANMKWESWDVDVQEVLEPSGGCENGTTFVFHMKNGQKINCLLKDVVTNETLTFEGPFLGGAGKFTGIIKLIPSKEEDATKTTIDYTFGFGGFVGPLLNFVMNKPASEGTKHGLDNMIKMSREAQKAKQKEEDQN